MALAHEIKELGGIREEVLQAYLLTSLPMETVAGRLGLSPSTTEAYHDVFFDVRKKLDHSGWICAKAIGYRRQFQDPSTIGMVLRKLGYFAGDYILDKLLTYVLKHHAPSLLIPPPPVQLEESEEKAIRRVLAFELLPKDQRAALLMFHLHVEAICQLARSGRFDANTIGGNWLDFVSFEGDGSNLQSRLSSDWSPAREQIASRPADVSPILAAQEFAGGAQAGFEGFWGEAIGSDTPEPINATDSSWPFAKAI